MRTSKYLALLMCIACMALCPYFSRALCEDTSNEILITVAGDVTLGANMKENPKSTFYSKILAQNNNNYGYFFENVHDIFSSDDLTIVNFEGTLTSSKKHNGNSFCFRAPQEHVKVLTESSVEMVAFENNHTADFGVTGYDDTISTFEEAGILYSTEAHLAEFEVKGVSIALLSYKTFDDYTRLFRVVPEQIAAAKAKYDLVFVYFHWGYEKDYAPRSNQIKMGRLAVDSGADLVLGAHSHRVNPIECYQGKYIVYSLGNCVFSGNTKPDDMDTFLFQQKFIIANGQVMPGDIRIIPCSISSVTGANNKKSGNNDLKITPFAPGGDGAKRVISTMLKNSKGLDYALEEYPCDWAE